MLSFIFGLFFAAVALSFLSLLKTYRHIPPKEVKRMARAGDETAKLMYRPIAYGMSLPIVLWVVIGLSLGLSLVLLAHALPLWLALIVSVIIILAGFAWIPSGELSRLGVWLAKTLAPFLAWLLDRLNPILNRAIRFIKAHRHVTLHTGLFEKADLIELLEVQKGQPDSRISSGEIDMLSHALSFGDKLVSDVLIPKRVVQLVNAEEPIGPSLMAELHTSGHSRFPVFDGKKANIIGILYLHDLVSTKRTGKVRDIMKTDLKYVHEDFTLYQTLQAFIKTKRHLFLVVNSFEEFVGIVTIEDVIESMVGKMIMDEFDHYEDLRAVAAKAAHKEHAEHKAVDSEPEAETEPTDT